MKQRIVAGLAALVFAGVVITAQEAHLASITPSEAADHIGQTATVCGPVASARHSTGSRGRPTFINLGKPFPRHVFTVVIWGDHRSKFEAKFGGNFHAMWDLDSVVICVTGRIRSYKGKPQIEPRSASAITVQKGG